MSGSSAQAAADQEALAALKRLSKAGLEIFEIEPALCSTVDAWINQRLAGSVDGSVVSDKPGVAALVSEQQVVQLLSAALTTLLKGLATLTADDWCSDSLADAFQQLGRSLSLCTNACKDIWPDDDNSRDKQERQKVALQAAKPGLFPAIAAACETEATILQQLRQQFEQQQPEQQRSLANKTARHLSQHFNLGKWLLSLWMFTASVSPNFTRLSGTFMPVAEPLTRMALQLLLACSAVTTAISSSSSSSSSSGDQHPLLDAAPSAMTQVFAASECVSRAVAEGIAIDTRGRPSAAAVQAVCSDHVLRLLLAFLAASTEQLYLRQRRKLRKAAAAASSSAAGSSSSSSAPNTAAAAAADLPEPYHKQLFTALGLAAADAARSRDAFLSGPYSQQDSIYAIYTCVASAIMFKQEQRATEPLIRGGSWRGGPAGSFRYTNNSSSSSSSGAGGSVPEPVVPAELMRPLLLTAIEACLLDAPLNVISSCSELMWVMLLSSTWVPGGQPPGAATAAAAAAATQLQQQLGGPAKVQELLQVLLQQAGPVVIAAYRRGKLVGALRREDGAGALKGHSRSVSIQGFGGAVISLACSVDTNTLAAAVTAGQQPLACCNALKSLEASYRDACSPGPDQYLHPLQEITLQAFGSKAMAALRCAAGISSISSTPAAAAGSGAPLIAVLRAAIEQQQQQGEASAAGQDEQQQQLLLPKRLYSLLVSILKGLLLCNGDTAAGDIRLMIAAIDASRLAVSACDAIELASSSSSSEAASRVQRVSPWMALAARGVTTAIEMHMSLKNENAAGLAALVRSNSSSSSSSTDQEQKQVASKPDAPLLLLLPSADWLVQMLQEQQQPLGVPAELLLELQQINQNVQMAGPAAIEGMCMRINEDDVRAMRLGATVGAAEMGNAMHRVAMPILAQTPHVYACNNPGCGSMGSIGELELVTGKNSVCSGCRAARLCCSDCMKAHWHRHKPVCKRIAARSKTAAAAAAK